MDTLKHSAVITDCTGGVHPAHQCPVTPVRRSEPPTSGLELGRNPWTKGRSEDASGCFCHSTQMSAESNVKREWMSVVNNIKTAASRQNFAIFSFPSFQLNIPIKLRQKMKML